MALSFHLVKRPDMRKDAAEGSKLFYACNSFIEETRFQQALRSDRCSKHRFYR